MLRLGQVLLGVSIAALGALTLGIHDFALAWSPLPKWLVLHDALAAAFAALLLAAGVAVLVPRAARPAALLLAILLLLQLLLQVPLIVKHPLVMVVYENAGETLSELGGAWTLFSLLPDGPLAALRNVRIGRILFALALLPFGLAHFVYLEMTAPLIPSWLPFHVPLAWFTGAAYVAAGLGILFGVLPRLAATLNAVMVSLFTLVIWVPAVIAAPAKLSDWSEFCVSTAITGAAWIAAASFAATHGWVSRQNPSSSKA
ncbi:MAG TPA: hypothetical protein VMU08_09470 [Rhizomicrobium sp.]|nr:hypothetical protein [Rhizomicrobium sp.]